MKFGVNTLIWSGGFDDSIPLAAIQEAGIDGIEVPVFGLSAVDPAALRKAVEDHGLACNLCSVNVEDFNPLSDDADVRRRTLDYWKGVIAIAGEVGAELLVGPTYSPVGYLPGRRRTEDEWKRGVEFHQQLGDALDDANVDLAVEPLNRFETYFLNTTPDAVRFAEEIDHPRIGLLIDTFHSHIEDKSTPDAYRLARKHLKHVHTCENDRGIPGSGQVPWAEVFQTLKEIGYDGWLTIESFNATIPDIASATAIWRDLAPKTDDIAIEGTAFIKKMWAAA